MYNIDDEVVYLSKNVLILLVVLMLVLTCASLLVGSEKEKSPKQQNSRNIITQTVDTCYIESKGDKYSIVCPNKDKRHDCTLTDDEPICIIRSIKQ